MVMTMEGKRFAAGILGGLLLAVAVIASQGVAPGLYGTFSPLAGPGNQADRGGATNMSTTTTMITYTTSATSTYGTSNQTQQTPSNPPSSTTTSTLSSSTSNPDQPAGGIVYYVNNLANQASASKLSNFGEQSATTNVIVLVPVLVAFLLGAVIYRLSRKAPEDDSQDSEK